MNSKSIVYGAIFVVTITLMFCLMTGTNPFDASVWGFSTDTGQDSSLSSEYQSEIDALANQEGLVN